MNIPFLDLKRQLINLSFHTEKLINDVLDDGQFILGDKVDSFENQFARYIGVDHCVSCGNGTDALELALEVVGIGPGDEVIVPDFGWVSPYTAASRMGATVVPANVDPVTGNLTADFVAEKCTSKTRAVIPIHLFGNPCDIMRIKALCEQKDLVLIEDCAQAHGAEVAGKKVGSFGDLSVFSFYPTKNLGSLGDAGAVLTNHSKWADKLANLRDYGRIDRHHFKYKGRNSRMDELQAAVLLKKLPYLDEWNQKRKATARHYFDAISSGLSDVWSDSVFYVFILQVKNREMFREELLDAGIATDIHYPFTISGVFRDLLEESLHSRELSERVVSIPIFPELTQAEISYICDHLKRNQDLIL